MLNMPVWDPMFVFIPYILPSFFYDFKPPHDNIQTPKVDIKGNDWLHQLKLINWKWNQFSPFNLDTFTMFCPHCISKLHSRSKHKEKQYMFEINILLQSISNNPDCPSVNSKLYQILKWNQVLICTLYSIHLDYSESSIPVCFWFSFHFLISFLMSWFDSKVKWKE